MSRVLAFLLYLVGLWLFGCAFEPPGAEPFAPPAEYRALWDSAQACSGRRGDFAHLRFFVVPGYSFDCPGGRCAGHTEGRTIWLAEDWHEHAMVVKHELIHALGVGDHPYRPFTDPCHATWASYRPHPLAPE